MKGKNISRMDGFDLGIGGLSSGFGGMLFNDDYEDRVVKNTEGKDYVVDTAYANDTRLFETGISSQQFNGGLWIIVDEYKTKQEAKRGHDKWVKYMNKNPKKLTDIHINETFTK